VDSSQDVQQAKQTAKKNEEIDQVQKRICFRENQI